MLTIRAIARKDLLTILRNRGVRTPIVVTPIVMLGLLPLMLIGSGELLAAAQPIQEAVVAGGAARFDDLTERAAQQLLDTAMPPEARWSVFVLDTFVAPLYLLVPLITATVIAADSFAGERERGTLEALLHSATTDRDLVWGKFLAAFIPALTVAWVSFGFYAILANALVWRHLGGPWFPTPTWWLLALWVAPALAAFGLSMMVVASSRVRSLQAAHQVGSLVVLPIVVLMVAVLTGSVMLEPLLVTSFGAGVLIVAAMLLWLGSGSLRRERLAERL